MLTMNSRERIIRTHCSIASTSINRDRFFLVLIGPAVKSQRTQDHFILNTKNFVTLKIDNNDFPCLSTFPFRKFKFWRSICFSLFVFF